MVKVEYATPRSEQTGRVLAMVSTASSSVAPEDSMVAMILLVRVDKMFALTPLPSPSASTARAKSSVRVNSTLSPHSSSPYLCKLS